MEAVFPLVCLSLYFFIEIQLIYNIVCEFRSVFTHLM